MPRRPIPRRHKIRPEIQALRALAVTLVVIYHLSPQRLTGGFIGVDVFFVISGYLITAHLVRGLTSTPRLRLRDFYLRRAKRLLPASLLVLLVVAVLTLIAVPQTSWGTIGTQLLSSTFYVQNWTLATISVDYLAAGTDASPIQHFWSLSVEEQFYAAWPLVLLGLILLSKKRVDQSRKPLLVGIWAVTLASLIFSVWATWSSPSDAYFITPTRVWEFGFGALLAIAVTDSRGPLWFRAALSWMGLAGIGIAATLFTGATPFPGYAALLPVIATVSVIFAGSPDIRWAPTVIFKLRPVQFIGDTSYSIYLWHWPLIVLWPTVVGDSGSKRSISITIIVLSILLGWLTKVFIEDRFRRQNDSKAQVTKSRNHTTWTIAIAMAAITAMGGVMMVINQTRSEAAYTQLASYQSSNPLCVGADAFDLDRASLCTELIDETVYPDPVIASEDVAHSECQQRSTRPELITCTVGSTRPNSFKVALIGDSHAGHWLAAVEAIANKRGWTVTTYLKSGCAYSSAASTQRSCEAWNRNVSEAIDGQYDLLITSSVSLSGSSNLPIAVDGLRQTWLKTTTPVVAIADIPRPASAGVADPPSCVDTKSQAQCSFPQSLALHPEPQKDAAKGLSHVYYLDMTKYFCRDEICPAVAGNVLIYRDSNHMTATFATSLATYLETELDGLGVID
jgi:peptidoglycan/LPS O-acetylase OafA/YrhL